MKVEYHITAGRLAELSGGRLVSGRPDTAVETVTSDSRELGENCLFIPLIGEKFNGHRFIRPLCEQGLINSFLTMEDGFEETALAAGVTAVRCPDTLKALGMIASHRRREVNAKVIGITGTNGKTTTKELVYAILSTRHRTLKNEKNYNNEIGVPFTLLGLRPEHTFAVIEMGMNHAGEIGRLSAVALPNVGVITNAGEGHLEFLGSVENVAAAKSEIMLSMKPGSPVVLNCDSDQFEFLNGRALGLKLQVVTFGLSDRADVRPDHYELHTERMRVVYRGMELSIPLYGIHNLYNVMAALAVATHYCVPVPELQKALAGFANVGGRSEILDRGYIVVDDTYNSNPLSSRCALRSVSEVFSGRRKIAVLSDMKELGEKSEELHRRTGREVAENGFEYLFLWGEMAEFYAEGAKSAGMNGNHTKIFNSKDDLSCYLRDHIALNDVVLIKGSRSMKMEEVTHALRA